MTHQLGLLWLCMMWMIAPVHAQLNGATAVHRPEWVFEKILDSHTPVPHTSWVFTGFRPPAVSSSDVVFTGFSPSYQYDDVGIYRVSAGPLEVIVDHTTHFPGPWPTAEFDIFDRDPSSDGTGVAFIGYSQGAGSSGLFHWTPTGGLQTLLNKNTPVPGGTSNFVGSCLQRCTTRQGQVAFHAYQVNFSINGIFFWGGSGLSVLADTNTAIPGGSGNFSFFTSGAIQLVAPGVAAFQGSGSGGQNGIFWGGSGPMLDLVDQGTPVPAGGGSSPIGEIRGHDYDGGTTAFYTFNQNYRIYKTDGVSVSTVLLQGANIPGTIYNFAYFDAVAIDNGRIAFSGGNQFVRGVFTADGGVAKKVLQKHDLLDGKTVLSVSMRNGGFRAGRIGLAVSFTNGTSAVYVARS